MISSYNQKGWPAKEIELFKVMIASKDLKSDEVTGVCVFSANGHLGALKPHNWVVNILIENHNKLRISG